MIVLDEHLGESLLAAVDRWYRGRVCRVTDLRPHSLIKDEAIPHLLRLQRFPTFVTVNESDFWQRVAIDRRFCVICFVLQGSQAAAIAPALKALLRHPRFRTKADRMGCVIRVSGATITYYRHDDALVRVLE